MQLLALHIRRARAPEAPGRLTAELNLLKILTVAAVPLPESPPALVKPAVDLEAVSAPAKATLATA